MTYLITMVILILVVTVLYYRGTNILKNEMWKMIFLLDNTDTLGEGIQDVLTHCRMRKGIVFYMIYEILSKINNKFINVQEKN